MARKAIIYSRVSTDEQRIKGFSLQDQEQRLRRFCRENNWEVIAHFQDDHSAKTFDRPEFQKMLQALKNRELSADLFLTVRMDRFSRNALESLKMVQVLKSLGLEFRTIEQDYDLSIPENLLPYVINMVLPQIENERRGLNTLRGMRQAKKEGRWVAGAPRGYSFEKINGKSYLQPNDDAPFILEAFKAVAEGVHGVEKIRKKLYRKGFKTSKSQFPVMLRNIVYTGKIYIEAWRDEPETFVEGLHEALISEDLFDQVGIPQIL